MADSSWDNSSQPTRKLGLGTGMKVLMGCGIATLAGLLTCAVGGAVLGNFIKKDPKAFEQRVEGFAQGLVQKDWERFRTLVDQLRTDDDARTLYRANPDLHRAWATEDQFLQAARTWRPRLGPLPAEAPVGRHRHGGSQEDATPEAPSGSADMPSVSINKVFGTSTIRCRYPGGTRVSATFAGERVRAIEVD
jgi:hypothetical protein